MRIVHAITCLLRAGAEVSVIERDARCLPALAEIAEAFPGKLTVHEGDALAEQPPLAAPMRYVQRLRTQANEHRSTGEL